MIDCIICHNESPQEKCIFITDDSKPICNNCREEMKIKLVKVLKNLTNEQWIKLATGHDLYLPSFYTEMGFSESFAYHFVREHKSDGTWKGSITTTDGKILATVLGVYNLEFLIGLKDILGIETTFYFGRGTYAREIITRLQEELK